MNTLINMFAAQTALINTYVTDSTKAMLTTPTSFGTTASSPAETGTMFGELIKQAHERNLQFLQALGESNKQYFVAVAEQATKFGTSK